MKANELRIGNLVKILPDQNNEILEVIQIKESEISLWMSSQNLLIDLPHAAIVPIEISSEIIERFGFELHDYDLFDELDSLFEEGDSKCTTLTYKIKPDSFTRFYIGVDLFEEDQYCQVYSFNPQKKNNDGNLYHHYVQYVHQLQNLYFAVTGEELTIK